MTMKMSLIISYSLPKLRTVMQELQEMIKEVNPSAKMYKHAGDVMRENPTGHQVGIENP